MWHPQIVHDIHQMGSNGARIFFPPFIDPYEQNIDPALISGVNQLGAYMAAELTAQGKKGVVINNRYDGFTPARAYQHYHGGVRILSETASVRDRHADPTSIARIWLADVAWMPRFRPGTSPGRGKVGSGVSLILWTIWKLARWLY